MRYVYCCACRVKVEKNKATTVPKDEERRRIWVEIFGKPFNSWCNFYKVAYVCLAHFENNKRTRTNLPLKIPPRSPRSDEVDHWVWVKNKPDDVDDLDEPMELTSEEQTYELSSNEDNSSGDEADVVPPANPFEYKYIMSKSEKIVELLKKCRKCASKSTTMNVHYEGFAIKCECVECGRKWTWENSNVCPSTAKNNRLKLKVINLDAVAAIFVSGESFQTIKGCFDAFSCPIVSDRSYRRLKKRYVHPAVDILYADDMKWVRQKVIETSAEGGLLNICGDGSYDSRGRSALYCRYIFMTCDTKLVIDYEIVTRKADEKKVDMEAIAFKKGFARLISENQDDEGNQFIFSFTSDRSRSISKLMTDEFHGIEHFFDAWHFIRSICLEIVKKLKQKSFQPLVKWFRGFLNQLYYSIHESGGDGELARERLLSFFPHSLNVHKDFSKFQEFSFLNFQRVDECEHYEIDENDERVAEFLTLENPKHVKALNCLLSLIRKGDRLEAIKKVSPFYATSSVESFNSRACFYASKDRFYSKESFDIRNKLAVIDWNRKQRDELEGRRVIVGEKKYYNKTTKSYSTRYKKTPADFSWRKEISKIAARIRAEEKGDAFDGEDIIRRYDNGTDESEDDDTEDDDDYVSDRNLEAIWRSLPICSDNEDEAEEIDAHEINENKREEFRGLRSCIANKAEDEEGSSDDDSDDEE